MPPSSVRNTLYGYVARLRSAIAKVSDPGVTLSHRPGGYLLRAEAEQLDLCRFRRLSAEAAAESDDKRRAGLLRQALGLWRGSALADVQSSWLNAMRDALEAERVSALEDLNDIRLRQGDHGALVGELTDHAVARPGDERLIAQLMVALYRSGRQVDALHWYERTRRYLASEIGVDPGTLLRTLRQQILRADPELAMVEGDSVHLRVGHQQLLPGAPVFSGRDGASGGPGSLGPNVTVQRRRNAEGWLPPHPASSLHAEPLLPSQLAREMLSAIFEPFVHHDPCAVGSPIMDTAEAGAGRQVVRRRPDPEFRHNILMAYEYQCAFCGFDGLIEGGSTVGLGAAYVRWWSHEGPDEVGNGLCLCSIHHNLFDAGILGVTSENKIMVSARFAARSKAAELLVVSLSGQDVSLPLGGFPAVAGPHAEWHARAVFRAPARPA
jgi:putative restriction endonuclease